MKTGVSNPQQVTGKLDLAAENSAFPASPQQVTSKLECEAAESCLARCMMDWPGALDYEALRSHLIANSHDPHDLLSAVDHMLKEKWIREEGGLWSITQKGIGHFFRLDDGDD